MNAFDIARFWSRVNVVGDDRCWVWNGNLPDGEDEYGRFDGNRAHRVAYEIVYGAIPAGEVIRHSCDYRRCVNPRHLKPGSKAENTADAMERGRLATGARHGRTKLSDADVADIRSSAEKGTALAVRFGVSASTISYIRSGRSWKAAA